MFLKLILKILNLFRPIISDPETSEGRVTVEKPVVSETAIPTETVKSEPKIIVKGAGMKLYVIRQIYTQTSTLGELVFNHKVFCYTLEDVVRKPGMPKVPGQTAIPTGCYEMIVNMSNRFKRMMPLLLNVPGFDGVRIHGGNVAGDTEGCLLVAYNKTSDTSIQGTAEAAITELLQSNKGPHYIEIINTSPYYGIS